MITFDVGDTVSSTRTFKKDGAVVDPASVTAKLKTPAGVESTPSVSRASDGNYYFDIEPSEVGTYWVQWRSTTPKSSTERSFYVRPSNF